MKRKRNSFLSKPKNLVNILDTMSSKDSDFPCVRWGDVLERFEHPVPGLYFEQLAAWPGVAGGVPGTARPVPRKDKGARKVDFRADGEYLSCPEHGAQLCFVPQGSEFIFWLRGAAVDFFHSAGLPDVCWPQVFSPRRRPCRLWDQQGWGVCEFPGFPRAEGASLGWAGLGAGTQGHACGTQSLTLCWPGLGSEEWWGKLEGIIPAPWIAWD